MPEEDEVDALYGLPLDEFVAARDALAKRLRADKRRDEAADVAKLAKPSVAAWAVNQVVRTQGAAVRELWQAGEALLAAQRELLAGRADASAMRSASHDEQAALTPLLQAARGLLDAHGRGPTTATLEKVGETLHAAAIEPAAREEVAAGRLSRELAHVGLGVGEGEASPPPAAEAQAPPAGQAPEPGPAHTGRDRLLAAMRASISREAQEAARGPDSGGSGAPEREEPAIGQVGTERAGTGTQEHESGEPETQEPHGREPETQEGERRQAEAQAREAEEARTGRIGSEAQGRERHEADAPEQERREPRALPEEDEQRVADAQAHERADVAEGVASTGSTVTENERQAAERALGEAVRARETAAGEVVSAAAALHEAQEQLRLARAREREAAIALARMDGET